MTIKEAEKQIEMSEQQITASHQKLVNEVMNMSSEADRMISGSTRTKTLLPLIVSLIGVLIISSRPALGLLLICIGVYISYKSNLTGKIAKNQVRKLCSQLNDSARNSDIRSNR